MRTRPGKWPPCKSKLMRKLCRWYQDCAVPTPWTGSRLSWRLDRTATGGGRAEWELEPQGVIEFNNRISNPPKQLGRAECKQICAQLDGEMSLMSVLRCLTQQLHWTSRLLSLWMSDPEQSDEYANRIPNPEHMPKYTKVKVLYTQDKQCIS